MRCSDPCKARFLHMVRLDHLTIPVTDLARSRIWYTANLGMKIEFEIPGRAAVALQDDTAFI